MCFDIGNTKINGSGVSSVSFAGHMSGIQNEWHALVKWVSDLCKSILQI